MFEEPVKKYGASIGITALITAALLWGCEYVAAKDVLNTVGPNWINLIKNGSAAVIALAVWRNDFKTAKCEDWIRAVIRGVFLGVGDALQIMGLELVNAGINAFISVSYVVMIPFIIWIIEKTRPACNVLLSAGIAMAGIMAMSVTGIAACGLSIGKGELFSFMSALCYAGAIVTADYFTRKTSVSLMTGIQFIVSFAIAGIMVALLNEPAPLMSTLSAVTIIEFIYMIVFSTFLTRFLFTFGIKYTSASQAGIVSPLESVSAALLGCVVLHEVMNRMQIAGCVLVLISIIISSVDFRKKK